MYMSLRTVYLQVLPKVSVDSQTVLAMLYERFGSLSQVTAPDDATFTNLYSNDLPGATLIVYVQRGFELVYLEADMAGAALTSQLPSSGIDPTTLIV